MRNDKTVHLVRAAVIAAMYAALTYVAALMGLAYGPVQFRISEVLTILPLFTFDAVPGLVIGCFLGNLMSTVGSIDLIFGTAATLIAALATYFLRKVTFFRQPVLGALMPVISNGIIIAFELTFFLPDVEASLAVYAANAGWVALGEAVICLGLGLPLAALIRKNPTLNRYIADKPKEKPAPDSADDEKSGG